MTDSVLQILRREMPALGLCTVFAPMAQREAIAALLLLWLELRRAGQASESMLAATRMAWWRDALAAGGGSDGGNGSGSGAPLADALIKFHFHKELSGNIDKMVEHTLSTGNAASPHSMIAPFLARATDMRKTGGIANILTRLDAAIGGGLGGAASGGRASGGGGEGRRERIGHITFDLIGWCCEKPTRLEYPNRHPLLALQMVGRVLFMR